MSQAQANIQIRIIEPRDNIAMAKIIRSALEEFGANKLGTVYYDDTTDALFELFDSTPMSCYWVAEMEGEIVGGAGIYPTPDLPTGTCELVKMYLKPSVRNIGLGRRMMQVAMDWAKSVGYTHAYLETMPELKKAVAVYEALGYKYLNGPLGDSGHHGCDIWMLKEL